MVLAALALGLLLAGDVQPESEVEAEAEVESGVVSPVGIGLVPRLQFPRESGEVWGLSIAAPWARHRAHWGVMVGGIAQVRDFSGGLQLALVADADAYFGLQVGAVALAGDLPKTDKAPIAGTSGAQLAGLLARSAWVDGAQISTGFAVAGDMYGFQGAGLVAHARWTIGFQLGGALARAEVIEGVQLGGGLALTRDMIGVQLAGGLTYSRDDIGTGVQIAGALNIAEREHTGLQLSALGNYAGCVVGAQVGLINVTGNLTGAQVGLINVARRGGLRFMPVLNVGAGRCR